ncbi:uncharacterized protein B0T23DRAFT_399559 [Neurospora hispaniola]|uniref:Uncharacterized protein n=1 Tax=Neurospora hispaniola TaxID=588809 RepID=A0AAJ0MMC8_9PEZI|nr:hypothetical protein B0T23DRAFT_399559 [Neurospora hispaniola]
MFCGLPIPFQSRSGHNASTMEPRKINKLRRKQKKVQLASSNQFQYQGKPPKGPARTCNNSTSPEPITPGNGPRPSHSHPQLTPRGAMVEDAPKEQDLQPDDRSATATEAGTQQPTKASTTPNMGKPRMMTPRIRSVIVRSRTATGPRYRYRHYVVRQSLPSTSEQRTT